MLAELPEEAATGPIAEIYGEIRRLWAVPYVSSLQRHLATRPGWLEWSWSALEPAFQSGVAQNAGWRLAAGLDLPRLAPMDAANLGVGPADLQTIRDVCASFVRVAPVNLIFAGLLRRLMSGERPDGGGWPADDWRPPAAMPARSAASSRVVPGETRTSRSEGRNRMVCCTAREYARFDPGSGPAIG